MCVDTLACTNTFEPGASTCRHVYVHTHVVLSLSKHVLQTCSQLSFTFFFLRYTVVVY